MYSRMFEVDDRPTVGINNTILGFPLLSNQHADIHIHMYYIIYNIICKH
jgi:hypothetical protein